MKIENGSSSALYRFSLVLPDKTIICRATNHPLANCEVGGLVTAFRPTNDPYCCVMPVKVTGIGDKGEIITLTPIGKPQKVQRRIFPRAKVESGISLKLQFRGSPGWYQSKKVNDISANGLGMTMYSRKPILAGQRVELEMVFELTTRRHRVNASGEVVYSTLQNEGMREFVVGIKFTNISDLDQTMLIEYVEEELKRQQPKKAPAKPKNRKKAS